MAIKREHVLSGRNVYFDKHDRAIYYDKRAKIGYVVPKETETKFRTFTYRYMIGIIAFVFLEYFFVHNLLISIPFGLAVIGYLEYSYRKLLPTLSHSKAFSPENAITAKQKMLELEVPNLLLRAFLYLAVSVLLILNLFATPNLLDDMVVVVASAIFSAGALVMAIRFVLVIIQKNKNK